MPAIKEYLLPYVESDDKTPVKRFTRYIMNIYMLYYLYIKLIL